MKTYILGVDPGFDGALAIYDAESNDLVAVNDMPTMENPKNGQREIDVFRLAALIDMYATQISLAVIEEVGARPNESVTAVFRFGFGAGILKGVIGANQIRTFYVKPQVWKTLMNLSHDKNKSLELARRRFPAAANDGIFKRQKDHGRAEAALLAAFAADRGMV